MKTCPFPTVILFLLVASVLANAAQSPLLDDTWSDGDRTNTALPEESAWFASNAGTTPTLSVAPGLLTCNVRMFETNTGSRLWITHFTPAGAPVELVEGDTLKISVFFRALSVATNPATGRGLRVGLFNFSEPGAARVTADGFSTGSGGGAPGANVTGYLLNQNFCERFSVNNPIQIMKRTDTPNVNLMGASAVFTALGSGGGASDTPGFQNDTPYRLEFSVKRSAGAAEITCLFADNAEWSIQHTATDANSPTFRFDGFAIRPNSAADAADSFQFSRVLVEHIPFQVRLLGIEYPTLLGARISWSCLPGKTYQVEWSQTLPLEPEAWIPLTTVVAGAAVEFFDDGDAFFVSQGFYRVVQLP